MDTLRSLGCEVHAVPAVPITDPQNYNHQAKRAAAAMPNAVWLNQFDNTANRMGKRTYRGIGVGVVIACDDDGERGRRRRQVPCCVRVVS